jgi:hypothetical protein
MKAYEARSTRKIMKQPVWIDGGRKEHFRIALSTMIIKTLDHPFFKQLRGEDIEDVVRQQTEDAENDA